MEIFRYTEARTLISKPKENAYVSKTTVAIVNMNIHSIEYGQLFGDDKAITELYAFESEEEAEKFASGFNRIRQVGVKDFKKATVLPQAKPMNSVKPYLVHTVRVNHLSKRILSHTTSIVTEEDVQAMRAEKDDAPLVRAFDAFRKEKHIWDDWEKTYETMRKGIRASTPLDGDVVVSITNGSESIGGTYISFFPDIRMRINASWDKTTRVHDDDDWWDEDEDEATDTVEDEDRGYKWVDCSEWYLCKDCDVDTSDIDEYVMIDEDLWESCTAQEERENPEGERHRLVLCIGCIEKRIGRRLTSHDFPTDVPLNWSTVDHTESVRLQNRMTDGGDVIWKQDTCELIYTSTGKTVPSKFTKYALEGLARRQENA